MHSGRASLIFLSGPKEYISNSENIKLFYFFKQKTQT